MLKRKIVLIASVALISCLAFSVRGFSQAIQSVRYTATTDAAGMQTVSQCFVKGTKFRIESSTMGQSVIVIYDGQKAYMYMAATGVALEIPLRESPSELPIPTDYTNIPGIVYVGKETVDGVLCNVYEYQKEGALIRLWVKEADDIPYKTKAQVQDEVVTTYISNFVKNIPLDDSLFMLPLGVSVVDPKAMMESFQPPIQ